MQFEQKNKKVISVSNVITLILVVFTAAMFIFPEFKATILQGLMKVGLFQPDVPTKFETKNTEKIWNVSFTNSNGEIIDGNSLKGRVVFINYWATWCPPCIAEMPSVNELYALYKNNPDIVFLLVDTDNDLKKSAAFMKKRAFDLPVYASKNEAPVEWFEGSLPTTVVLNKEGNLVFRETGAADYNSKKFKTFIANLLNE